MTAITPTGLWAGPAMPDNHAQDSRSTPTAQPTPAAPTNAPPGSRGDWLRALAVVLACTAISELMLPVFDLADQIMVYLAGVVFVALRYGMGPSLAAVVFSIFLFDLIFVPPRWGLNPLDKQHLFTFGVMLAVGLLISRLAARARVQALLAEARAQRAQALSELARHLVTARSQQDIADGLAGAVRSVLHRPCALLLADEAGSLADAQGFCGGPDGVERQAAQRAFTQGREAGAGAAQDAPAQGCYLPLRGAGTPLGVLAVAAAGNVRQEDKDLLSAFANQAALALERFASERRSAAALVEAEGERLRSTLLSGVSHDFRTPLTTIVGSATVLLEQDHQLDAARRLLLARSILDEARRMHALVSDLLDLTRMEEGAVRPNHEWCPADELVAAALQALGPRAQSRHVRVRIEPDAIVWCDPRLVEQVLVNLLDNALRHSPAGGCIDVGISVDAGRGSWQLVVADDGPGVPRGHEHDVFKKFYRGNAEPAGTGTGLGLAICAAAARVHGGTIAADNDGGGARFTMRLPQPARREPQEEIA